jgi:site-specific recombinase XerD
MTLEPIDPETAVEMYLADRKHDLAQTSIKAAKYRLRHFVRWCDEEDITNLNELTGRRLHEYRLWRRADGDINKVTEKTQMDQLRVFVRWLESIDAVKQDLSVKVRSPDVTPSENARDVMLESERAAEILEHMERYEYCSARHVALSLMWHTMMRIGGVHALDLEDYEADEQYLEVHHRAETDTPIKNKGDGERLVALSDDICALLDDWIADQRREITDDHGRNPLLTSAHGRLTKSTLRAYIYEITRPCVIGNDCPHSREEDSCEATEKHKASQCPSSVSPHAIRRGGITHNLNNEMPDTVVGDRANVSPKVIEQHYDRRTKREKMEQRRDYVDDI